MCSDRCTAANQQSRCQPRQLQQVRRCSRHGGGSSSCGEKGCNSKQQPASSPAQHSISALHVVRRQNAQLRAALQQRPAKSIINLCSELRCVLAPSHGAAARCHCCAATKTGQLKPCSAAPAQPRAASQTNLEGRRLCGSRPALLEGRQRCIAARQRCYCRTHRCCLRPAVQLGVINPLQHALARHGLQGGREQGQCQTEAGRPRQRC